MTTTAPNHPPGLLEGGTLAAHRVGVLARLAQLTRCWWIQLKMLAVDPFTGVLQLVWPLFFATTAFLVFRLNEDPAALVYAALGAAVMGTWSAIATDASNALQRERWLGTLELLASSPTPFPLVMTPITSAMTTMGGYSMVATLLWGRLVFGISVPFESPLLFVVSGVVTILSVSMFGFLLAVTVVRYRTAWALGNLLEYPGWLLCGFLVPVSMLPTWAGWLSYALPPTWGMRAMRAASAGDDPWPDLLACVALGVLYFAIAALLAETILRSARRHATLSLT